MTNLRVKVKILEKNPDYHQTNSNTVAPYYEIESLGSIQGYSAIAIAGYQSMEMQAIVLVGTKLQNVPLKDITVLTDQS